MKVFHVILPIPDRWEVVDERGASKGTFLTRDEATDVAEKLAEASAEVTASAMMMVQTTDGDLDYSIEMRREADGTLTRRKLG